MGLFGGTSGGGGRGEVRQGTAHLRGHCPRGRSSVGGGLQGHLWTQIVAFASTMLFNACLQDVPVAAA